MKKAVPPKNEKRTKKKKTQISKVEIEAKNILRTVKDHEAFYFYETVGKPTGEIARNLYDFLDKVKTVKPESLTFHFQRKDFQNWIEKTLGDSKLAAKLERISPSNGDDVRISIYKTVENRIKQLKESLVQIHVEDSAVLVPAC
ncbi:hypothetical protein HXY32_07815 [Candidatus Bathyarchaeota archaeon]|nr:hypothetical protein [Candidatus Bathyarchaeota archaeon]